MKKGLRLPEGTAIVRTDRSMSRPDEEGITTAPQAPLMTEALVR